MDDFNGTFCKNGSFPVIKSVRDCFRAKETTTKIMTTAMVQLGRNNGSNMTHTGNGLWFGDSSDENTDENKDKSTSNKSNASFLLLKVCLMVFLIMKAF
jgi:hypothetical protein